MSNGIVYLIGAGPGDPGLLTLRGQECLAAAGTVVYDYLANPELLAHAGKADELIYVGKQAGAHTMKQEDINRLLVEKGAAGRTIARLKGGDPFVFGRGGEEALALAEAGIPFEIIPGVTSGVAAAAYAGIPVTQRGCASALTFVTGHEDPTKEESAVDWESLAKGGGTLAIFMGVRKLPVIVEELLEHGRSPETPVALIQHGTLPAQRVVSGTLQNIVARVEAAKLTPPAIIIVGDVVRLRDSLRWFDVRPLFGKTVVVTRSRPQASKLAHDLAELGAEVLQFPTILIEPPDDEGPLRQAVSRLAGYDWILFTSTNAVEHFFRVLFDMDRDGRALADCRVAAIGGATTDALMDYGIRADLVPATFTSAALADALEQTGDVSGRSFLFPRADIAPETLAERLRAQGADIDAPIAYRTVPGEPGEELFARLREGAVDVVTFTSSSTVRNFVSMLQSAGVDRPSGAVYVTIGPETTRTAKELGIDVAAEANPHTIPGLVDAVRTGAS